MNPLLYSRRHQIRRHLELGRPLPHELRGPLCDFLDRAFKVRARRADSARQQTAERSAAIRARIRSAVGALPLELPLSKLTGIVRRRMGSEAPAARTIRDELRSMRRENSRSFGIEAPDAERIVCSNTLKGGESCPTGK